MKDKWLITLEVDTYDGNPAKWDWDAIFTGDDDITILESEYKGRVLPTSEGESND